MMLGGWGSVNQATFYTLSVEARLLLTRTEKRLFYSHVMSDLDPNPLVGTSIFSVVIRTHSSNLECEAR